MMAYRSSTNESSVETAMYLDVLLSHLQMLYHYKQDLQTLKKSSASATKLNADTLGKPLFDRHKITMKLLKRKIFTVVTVSD